MNEEIQGTLSFAPVVETTSRPAAAFDAFKTEAFRNGFALCAQCNTKHQLYVRTLSAGMAKALRCLKASRDKGIVWVQSTKFCAEHGFSAANQNFSLLKLWNFIEPYHEEHHANEPIPDDLWTLIKGRRQMNPGVYRLTDEGYAFAAGTAAVAYGVYTFTGLRLGDSLDAGLLAEYEAIARKPLKHAGKTIRITDIKERPLKKSDFTITQAAA